MPTRRNTSSKVMQAVQRTLAIAAMTGTTCTISNIRSSSLQGDAAFAKGILEPMGCDVVQTETETTVTGPPIGQLRVLGDLDMETMTDAFLTASMLAAVATQPVSKERVNSTDGMRDQLRRFMALPITSEGMQPNQSHD